MLINPNKIYHVCTPSGGVGWAGNFKQVLIDIIEDAYNNPEPLPCDCFDSAIQHTIIKRVDEFTRKYYHD